MRKWSHLPPIELISSPFKHEFATLEVHAARCRTLNFESKAESHFEDGGHSEIGVAK
jgi:hypothetical protein